MKRPFNELFKVRNILKSCFTGMISVFMALGFSSAVFANLVLDDVIEIHPYHINMMQSGFLPPSFSLPAAGCSGTIAYRYGFIGKGTTVINSSFSYDVIITDASGIILGPATKILVRKEDTSLTMTWRDEQISFNANLNAKRPFVMKFYDRNFGGYQGTFPPVFEKQFDPVNLTYTLPGSHFPYFDQCRTLDNINQNDPILYFGPPYANITKNEGEQVNIQLQLSHYFDPDGSLPTVPMQVNGLPPGVGFYGTFYTIDGVVAKGARQPTLNLSLNSSPTQYSVNVIVSDYAGSVHTETFNINIQNGLPFLSGAQLSNMNFYIGDNVYIPLAEYFGDPDFSENFSFTATNLPPGLSIIPGADFICPSTVSLPSTSDCGKGAAIQGTIASNAKSQSPYEIDVVLSDNVSGSVNLPFKIIILNSPPQALAFSDQEVVLNHPVEIDLGSGFQDDDGDLLTYSVTGLPPGLKLSPSGVIEGKVTSSPKVAYNINASSTDGEGSASLNFKITVMRVAEIPLPATMTPLQNTLSPQVSPSSQGIEPLWTDWLNRDGPGGSGDYETLKDFVAGGQIKPDPIGIECQTTSGVDWKDAGQVYTCTIESGGVCRNNLQVNGQRCQDYQIRFRY